MNNYLTLEKKLITEPNIKSEIKQTLPNLNKYVTMTEINESPTKIYTQKDTLSSPNDHQNKYI